MDLVRDVDPATEAALGGVFSPILMVFIDWPAAPVYAHTGVGLISWGGHIWVGVGTLGNVQLPAEAMRGVVAVEAILSLVGVPVDLDGLIDDQIRGRGIDVYFAVVAGRPGGWDGKRTEGEGNTLVGQPVSLFSGTMDALDLDANDNGNGVDHEARITVSTGPGARTVSSATITDESQRRLYPSDTAGRHLIMAYAKGQKITWPQN